VFLSGITNESLVHKLGQKSPRTIKELLDIATSHAFGEDAVGAIFDRSKGKEKQNKDADEGAFNRSGKKKKNKQRREGSFMAAAERKGKRAPTEGTPNHFKKTLEGPCNNPEFYMKQKSHYKFFFSKITYVW
jgi:hypothetical protein